jgi:hypothetical protein
VATPVVVGVKAVVEVVQAGADVGDDRYQSGRDACRDDQVLR